MGLSRMFLPNERDKTDWSQCTFRDVPPLDDVYADVILVGCPQCHAEQGDFCTNPITKKTRKIPCRKRFFTT